MDYDGLSNDTIIFYYGDHGGVLPRSKRYCYDEGLRVPLIVYVPPKWRHFAPVGPGGVVDAPVTLIDLPATLLSIAGVAQPAQMTGTPLLGRRIGAPATYAFGSRDRMDEPYDLVRTVTDGRWRYIRNYMPHRALGQHVGYEWDMQRSYREWDALYRAGRLTEQQARFFEPKRFEELYDLKNDLDQVNNLIDEPGASATAKRLRKSLDHHMLAINDNGFLPEGAQGEGYFASRDHKVYPLKTLTLLASTAARRDARNCKRFQALLRSPVTAIRVWAARGLLRLGDDARTATADLRMILTGDPSNEVKIVTAEALIKLGEAQDAVALLSRLADDNNSLPLRMQAFDALSNIGTAALPALPVIRKAANAQLRRYIDPEYPKRLATYLLAVLERRYDPTREGITGEACAAANKGTAMFMGPPPSANWSS